MDHADHSRIAYEISNDESGMEREQNEPRQGEKLRHAQEGPGRVERRRLLRVDPTAHRKPRP